MKKILLILYILISSIVFSQNIEIFTLSGYVFDENKEAVPFANILLTNSSEKVIGTTTDLDGFFRITNITKGSYTYKISYIGYFTKEIKGFNINKNIIDSVYINPSDDRIECIEVIRSEIKDFSIKSQQKHIIRSASKKHIDFAPIPNYKNEKDNDFVKTVDENTSTFSIDVDNASYTLLRKTILKQQQIPDSTNIRIEEMINYFNYNYAIPKDEEVFSVFTETGDCLWNKNARLLHIGVQGKNIDYSKLEASNLVFLIDVSGSMLESIDMIKNSLNLLVDKLSSKDKVSIVVYAGAAGEVLAATPANEKVKIKTAINKLSAGGSTAGGAGINLAYKIAKENFIKGANNRVILCTDGDFNVGVSSRGDLIKLIEEKRKDHIFLSVCGFGYALYSDKQLEALADKGNGNYYYIDSKKEADRVFVKQMRSTLFTIAKDMKIQIIFDTKNVKSYRLIGYSNRVLDNKDFKNDKKDAGELGAGQNVTALYEIVLYSNSSDENIGDIKIRYKNPKKLKSKASTFKIKLTKTTTSKSFDFASAVASFGMLLKKKPTANKIEIDKIMELANKSITKEDKESRKEFIEILKAYSLLKKK